jgi:hypothetical protein
MDRDRRQVAAALQDAPMITPFAPGFAKRLARLLGQ